MKKLILAAALTLSFNASAEEDSNHSICKKMSTIATSIMKVRQVNGSMARLMELAGDSKFTRALVIDAYKIPAYGVPENKARAVKKFANSTYAVCIEQLDK